VQCCLIDGRETRRTIAPEAVRGEKYRREKGKMRHRPILGDQQQQRQRHGKGVRNLGRVFVKNDDWGGQLRRGLCNFLERCIGGGGPSVR